MKVALAGSRESLGNKDQKEGQVQCAVASKALDTEWAAPSAHDGSPPAHLDLQEEVCPDAGRWASCAACRQMASQSKSLPGGSSAQHGPLAAHHATLSVAAAPTGVCLSQRCEGR